MNTESRALTQPSGRLTRKARAELEAWANAGHLLNEALEKAGARIVQCTCGWTEVYKDGVGYPSHNCAALEVTGHDAVKTVAEKLGGRLTVYRGRAASVSAPIAAIEGRS